MVGSAVSALNSTSFPSAPISAKSGSDDYVTDIEGGYVKVGNMVIVNVRFSVAVAFPSSWASVMTGFPKPIVRYNTNDSGIAVANNLNLNLTIGGNGQLWSNSEATMGSRVCMSCVYFTK